MIPDVPLEARAEPEVDLVEAIADHSHGELLAFLASGLAHALANPLQVILMQTTLLTPTTDTRRARDVIHRACGSAERLLDMLRCFADAKARTKPTQLGLFLPRVVEVLGFAVRERGIKIESLHTSVQTPVAVAQGPLTIMLTRLVRALARGVPAWWQGSFFVDLYEQTPTHADLRVGLHSVPGSLPFAMAIGPAIAEVCCAGSHDGLDVQWDDVSRIARVRVSAVPAIGAVRV